MIRQLKNRLGEILRFFCVGISSALIDIIVFNVFLFFSSYELSIIAGFIISWLFNYILSSLWTFSETPTVSNFVGMLLAHLTNLFVIRMGIMYLFVDVLNIHPRIAYIPTLMIAAVTSYFLVRLNFKHKF